MINRVGRVERRRDDSRWLPDETNIVVSVRNRHKRESDLDRIGHPADVVRRGNVRLAAARLVREILKTGKQALGFARPERAQAWEDRQPGNVKDVSISIYTQVGFDYLWLLSAKDLHL